MVDADTQDRERAVLDAAYALKGAMASLRRAMRGIPRDRPMSMMDRGLTAPAFREREDAQQELLRAIKGLRRR